MNDNRSGLKPADVKKLQLRSDEIEQKLNKIEGYLSTDKRYNIYDLIREKTFIDFKIYSYEINYYLPSFC